jgi:hypothetical protein
MNKIVREHYPVANLPEDLREGFDAGATVRIVVEGERTQAESRVLLDLALNAKPASWDEIMRMREKLLADGRPSVSMEEAVARIRELRDEWDD